MATDPLGILAEAPRRLLSDAWVGAGDAARSLAGRDRVRLAVTGLSRAGKTVMLTSAVANLLASGQRARTLPALEAIAGGRLVSVLPVPAGTETTPRFDALTYLDALAAEPPRWPERTEDLSTLSLALTLRRRNFWGQLLPDRQVVLDLLDYPGEWLLDLPMLGGSFDSWSDATLARLRRSADVPPVAAFLAFVEALPAAVSAEEALTRRGWTLYRDALRHGRDVLGLRFLQPGRALNPGPRGEAPLLWFFPLPPAVRGGALGALLGRRHDAYLDDQRREFFEPVFRRFDRQAVLVDVLGALHAGRAAFEDTAEALAAISGALRYGGSWLDRLTGAGVSRVAFAATKADHVPEVSRDALTGLLSDLVAGPKARIGSAGAAISVHALAAVRCTEEAVAERDGRPVPAVRGVLLDSGRWAKVDPGVVPSRHPGEGYWRASFFEMPVFRPPVLEPGGASGVPHLGLDAVLAALIGDLL
ncbi:YcjX family protein [Roseomonas sp. BN140053]|uniref:YcjX family protein n=1 Tax=Roseomonas sp. BN140053 TaxID=3391898 RepID=UPI0039E99050